jgi:hypothetical protein
MNRSICAIALGLGAIAAVPAQATPLKVVNVGAPAINCAFQPACTITVSDSVATFAWPSTIAPPSASAKLQSRTAAAAASGVPAAGTTVYMYRVTPVSGGSTDCVTGLTLDFGPVGTFDYDKSGKPSGLFVITSGGIGNVGVKSADQTGNLVTVTFANAICNTINQGSFFFGLATKQQPAGGKALAHVNGHPDVPVTATVASH